MDEPLPPVPTKDAVERASASLAESCPGSRAPGIANGLDYIRRGLSLLYALNAPGCSALIHEFTKLTLEYERQTY